MTLELSPLDREALDSRSCEPKVARATLNDLAKCNRLFGGRAAVMYGVQQLLKQSNVHRHGPITVLDVGAGGGDVVSYLVQRSHHKEPHIRAIALDWHAEAARLCTEANIPTVIGDAGALPVQMRSVDVIIASQLLHHYSRHIATTLVRTFILAARLGVVVADLRRARPAMWGIRFASLALNFHPATRHDGVLSVQRGFSLREFVDLFSDAGVTAIVRRRPGFRLVAVCKSQHADD